MKQLTLERAQRTVEAFLHEQYADAELDVMSVSAEVDGYGDEFIWIYLNPIVAGFCRTMWRGRQGIRT